MDAASHILLGACVAQIPRQNTAKQTSQQVLALQLGFWQRAAIGSIAGIFPDIDFLLFFYNPVEFLAYWHRAETHSLLLAPIWSWLIFWFVSFLPGFSCHRLTIYWIALLGILSHVLSDSLTTYGTQWFAPLSKLRIGANLLFVFDGYFTITLLICFYWLWQKQTRASLTILLLPLIYLAIVSLGKVAIHWQLERSSKRPLPHASVSLLPQPFSPGYWQAIQRDKAETYQAYVKWFDDPIATQISRLLSKPGYSPNFQSSDQLYWQSYSLLPQNQTHRETARIAWRQEAFKPFRDFAVFPVFYQQQEIENMECFWFSDLRYHWPDFLPPFRYGMCLESGDKWHLYRMQYLSATRVKISH